jgi:3-oxoacyl-[acyl-carrier-protein] synthase II
MASNRRIVLTGLGLLTPIGLNAAHYWESLSRGKSGIRRIRSFDASAVPTPIAGEIDGFDPKAYIDKKERKSLRVMARTIQLAVAAAQVAMDEGKVDREKLDPARFGVSFGAGLIPSELHELAPASLVTKSDTPGKVDLEKWGIQGIEAIQPLWMLKYLPNMLATHVSILQNAQGPSNSITESDVAGLLALGEATRIMRRNIADIFLVGGADAKINPLSLTRQSIFNKLATNDEQPEKACRPFDAKRDGMVIGEGGSVVIAEELEHARKRGARILAEVLGFGAAFDRGRDGKGLARAIRAALKQANVHVEQLDHINAHGLSDPVVDAWEAQGIREACGSVPVTVWAVKSYMGNLGAGSDMAELAASVLAMQHGMLPGTLNYETPDPACPVPVTQQSRPVKSPYFLKVGCTELGQCAAVVCKAWKE